VNPPYDLNRNKPERVVGGNYRCGDNYNDAILGWNVEFDFNMLLLYDRGNLHCRNSGDLTKEEKKILNRNARLKQGKWEMNHYSLRDILNRSTQVIFFRICWSK
jgi:hypothetical protein